MHVSQSVSREHSNPESKHSRGRSSSIPSAPGGQGSLQFLTCSGSSRSRGIRRGRQLHPNCIAQGCTSATDLATYDGWGCNLNTGAAREVVVANLQGRKRKTDAPFGSARLVQRGTAKIRSRGARTGVASFDFFRHHGVVGVGKAQANEHFVRAGDELHVCTDVGDADCGQRSGQAGRALGPLHHHGVLLRSLAQHRQQERQQRP